MTALRWVALVVLLAAVGIGSWSLMRAGPPPVLIVNAAAVPGMGGAVTITMGLSNDGAPDRLIGVASDMGEAVLVGAEGAGLALPGADTAILASDGAHVRLTGLADPEEGLLIPVTLRFETAGEVTTRALYGPGAGHAGMDMTVTPGTDEPAPELTLTVTPEGDGWTVRVETANFTFSEDQADGPHVPGIGHGHLYLNGLKLQRLYGPEAQIGPLPPGEHIVRVTLNANDHRTYAVDGSPVTATATITAR